LQQFVERRSRRGAGAVGIVDDEQRRALGARRARHRRAGRARIAGAGDVQHDAAIAMDLARELGGQSRLSRSAGAGDDDEPAGPGVRLAPGLAQRVELGPPADERRAGVELGRQRVGREPRRVEPGILAQDRLVQLAQLGPGLDADLLDQRRSRLPVGVQRLGLAPRAVEREHPLGVQPFAPAALAQRAPRARRGPRDGVRRRDPDRWRSRPL
jgi:hypothetical protein